MKLPKSLLLISLLIAPLAQAADNVSIFTSGDLKIHTFHGISNSHIIETANELRVIDTQMKLSHAEQLKAYIKTIGKPLKQVILSHNHPDHWFGAQVLAEVAPVASSENVNNDLKTGGGRYISLMAKKLGDDMPKAVIVPTETIALGAQNWDGLEVVVEEYAEQEAHHSLLIKLPAHKALIAQDMLYNNMFLVASEKSRNKNWLKLLQDFAADDEMQAYSNILIGHGKIADQSVYQQNIDYLQALEATMAKGLSQEETTASLIAQFPEKGGKGMLGISMQNMFHPH